MKPAHSFTLRLLVAGLFFCFLPKFLSAGEGFGFRLAPPPLVVGKMAHRIAGKDVRAIIRLAIKKDWHLYHTEKGMPDGVGIPLTITPEGKGIIWGLPRLPKPYKSKQDGMGKGGRDTWIYAHRGTILIYLRGTVIAGAGKNIGVTLTGQTCSDSGSCVPYGPTKLRSDSQGLAAAFKTFPPDLAAPAQKATAVTAPASAATATKTQFPKITAAATVSDARYDAIDFADLHLDLQTKKDAENRSLLMWLLYAFIAGAILNVMPCVLPVISIKVLSFVEQAGEDRKRIFALGLAFSGGIMTVFMGLGLLASGLALTTERLQWGDQFQNEPFKIVMVSILFAFSLSLFGVYEFGVPRSVGKLAAEPRKAGMWDAFFKGVLATILATPCTGPFLASTITWAATQPPATTLLIFFTLGVGMAMPYLILTANPVFLKRLPKPGAWMETFKQALGFLLLGSAIFFMFAIKSDYLIYTIILLLFIAFACWLWGRYGGFGKSLKQRWLTLLASVLIIAGGAYWTFAVLRAESTTAWKSFDYDRFMDFRKRGRTVLLDFTAEWCVNCKINEKVVYESAAIQSLIKKKNVVMVRVDMTSMNARTRMLKRLQNKLGGNAVPHLAIFPGDRPNAPYVRTGFVTVAGVSAILNQCP